MRRCILKCKHEHENDIKLHRFPPDKNRNSIWRTLLNVTDDVSKGLYACQRHFSGYMYAGTNLRKGAIPDVNLPIEPSDDLKMEILNLIAQAEVKSPPSPPINYTGVRLPVRSPYRRNTMDYESLEPAVFVEEAAPPINEVKNTAIDANATEPQKKLLTKPKEEVSSYAPNHLVLIKEEESKFINEEEYDADANAVEKVTIADDITESGTCKYPSNKGGCGRVEASPNKCLYSLQCHYCTQRFLIWNWRKFVHHIRVDHFQLTDNLLYVDINGDIIFSSQNQSMDTEKNVNVSNYLPQLPVDNSDQIINEGITINSTTQSENKNVDLKMIPCTVRLISDQDVQMQKAEPKIIPSTVILNSGKDENKNSELKIIPCTVKIVSEEDVKKKTELKIIPAASGKICENDLKNKAEMQIIPCTVKLISEVDAKKKLDTKTIANTARINGEPNFSKREIQRIPCTVKLIPKKDVKRRPEVISPDPSNVRIYSEQDVKIPGLTNKTAHVKEISSDSEDTNLYLGSNSDCSDIEEIESEKSQHYQIRVGTTYSPVVGDFLKLIKSHSALRSKRYVSPQAFDNAICDIKTKLNNKWNINSTSVGIRQSLNHLKKHNPNILNDLKKNQKLVKLLKEKYMFKKNGDKSKKPNSKPKKRKISHISKFIENSTLEKANMRNVRISQRNLKKNKLESIDTGDDFEESNKKKQNIENNCMIDSLNAEDTAVISDDNNASYDNDNDSNVNDFDNNDNDNDDEYSDNDDDDGDDDGEDDEDFNEDFNDDIDDVDEEYENNTIVTDHNYGQQNLTYTCDKCSASYKTERKLKKHIYVEHNIGDNPYKCSGCGKLFRNSHNFRTHSVLCLNRGQKYICHICGKYYSRFSIRHHMQLHQKPKFECKLCPKKYHKPYLFKEHMKTHKQARDNICEYCGKGYNTRKSLAVHRKVQHNLTFKCDICNLKLSSDAAVVRHKQYMHLVLEGTNEELEERTKFNRYPKILDPETNKRRYFCELCENTYANCSSLLSHRRNIHKIKPIKKNMYRKTVLRKWNKQKAATLQNSMKEEIDEYIPHNEYEYIEMREEDDIILEEADDDESFNLLNEYFELID